MIDTGDLRKGITIELDGKLYQVVDYQHLKLGRGSAQVRLRLKDIQGGHTIERTFQAGERFQQARLEHRPMQFLYEDDGLYHFMDQETFDQLVLSTDQVGDAVPYLTENLELSILTYQDKPVSVELPTAVALKVADTAPGFKGDTASAGGKPATTETGLTVQVPFFINPGDTIKVDTRSGQYLERVS
jgi:elongation factor P